MSPNTRRLVAEHGGFLYDSDAYDDDLPHYVEAAGKPHLILPYTLDNNDMKFAVPPGFGDPFGFEHHLAQQPRPSARRGRADDERRLALPPGRASGPGGGAGALPRPRAVLRRRVGGDARGDRAPLVGDAPAGLSRACGARGASRGSSPALD
jgi:hypothetical protein